MNDSLRESLSYFGLYKKMFSVQKNIIPESVSFGNDKDQYFLYYEPDNIMSDKVIIWVHGGGWNAGTPKYFDFVGQCIANARVSLRFDRVQTVAKEQVSMSD